MSLVRIQSPRPLPSLVAGRLVITVPVRYHRTAKALFIQKLQHAIPSVVVFQDGLDHVLHAEGLDVWLGAAEVGVSVLVMGTVLRGIRHMRHAAAHADHAHHHGVDWIDIGLSAMLAVESYAEFHATGHVPRPKILLSFTMLAVGLLHPQLAAFGDRRRELRVSDDGISVPRGKFGRLTLAWSDVASIDVDERRAMITSTDGRSARIDMADVTQQQSVRAALQRAQTLLGESRHAQAASIESNPSSA
jgi:hypothetical protein